MADITPTVLNANDRYTTWTWEEVGENDDPVAIGQAGRFPDKTIQVTGTFDSAVVTLEGSMDNVTYAPLTTDGTTAISFSAAGMKWIWENPNFIKPVVASAGASADIDIIIGAPNQL